MPTVSPSRLPRLPLHHGLLRLCIPERRGRERQRLVPQQQGRKVRRAYLRPECGFDRGASPMAVYTLSPFFGPIVGPLVSGFINQVGLPCASFPIALTHLPARQLAVDLPRANYMGLCPMDNTDLGKWLVYSSCPSIDLTVS